MLLIEKVFMHDTTNCDHEFMVFSTCTLDCSLLAECIKCGTLGVVPDPSKEEWNQSFDTNWKIKENWRVLPIKENTGEPRYLEREDP